MQAWYEKRKQVVAIMLLMFFAFILYRFEGVMDVVQKAMAICRPFIFGTILAILVNLPMRFLERNIFCALKPFNTKLSKLKRPLALTMSILFVTMVLGLIIVIVIPELHKALENIINTLPSAIRALLAWLNKISDGLRANFELSAPVDSDIRKQLEGIYQYLVGGIGSSTVIIRSAAGIVLDIVIAFIFAIYLLYSKEKLLGQFKKITYAYLKEGRSGQVNKVAMLTVKTFSSFIAGQCVQAFVSATLTFFVLLIFNMPYPLLIALMVFVTSFIPLFGPYISGILGTILVFSQRADLVLWFVLIFLFTQQVSGSVIFPRIMSDAISLPSIWVLVSVTLGGGIMGIAGMMFFIPLVSVLYRLLSDDVNRRIKNRNGAEQ